MPVVAGIDSSTQSCKVELRDLDGGRLLGTGSAPHPPAFAPCSEQRPSDWWTAFQIVLAAAVAVAGVVRKMSRQSPSPRSATAWWRWTLTAR